MGTPLVPGYVGKWAPGHGDVTACRQITVDAVLSWGPVIYCGIGAAMLPPLVAGARLLTLISLKED